MEPSERVPGAFVIAVGSVALCGVVMSSRCVQKAFKMVHVGLIHSSAIVAGAPPRTRTATPQRNPFAAPAWPVPCKYPTEIRDSDKGVGENLAGRRPRGNWPLGAGCRRPARGLLDLPVEPPAQFPA